ncbi:uncharacterized protein BX664DRAFT_275332 [Halteromyces radiatus]|uniref:uncharacterized protein n=1 Tax=Halteromyces radiatus TaxID=101107 RepID=UPI00221EE141|nr:uncharacterized protein BX664DRAFT_275332 [Halteromyces radiatus]KAI8096925.1 hypothetical protein BX664DRAFT_275332 [Halteromyces radiatus]
MSDEYDVKRVSGRCYIDNEEYYLIEWEGYSKYDNTWECKANLLGNDELVQTFLTNYQQQYPDADLTTTDKILLKDAFDISVEPIPSFDTDLTSTTTSLKSNKKKKSRSNKTNKKKQRRKSSSSAESPTTTISDLSSVISTPTYLDSESSDVSFTSISTPIDDTEGTKKKRQKLSPVVIPAPSIIDFPTVVGRRTIRAVVQDEMELEAIQSALENSKSKASEKGHELKNLPKEGRQQFLKVDPPVYVCNDYDSSVFPEIFVYIDDLILHSDVPEPDPDFLSGCECVGKCIKVRNSKFCHEDSAYRNKGTLKNNYQGAIYECTQACQCDEGRCPNRIVQRGRQVPLEIFKTAKKGWGVRCLAPIKQNTFVEQYLGEVITEAEGVKRGKVYDKLGLSYLFDMDLADGEGLQKYVIDSFICGNASHFFNHSCSPNLMVYGVFYDSMDPSFHRLAFFARRDIAVGEELTFDYTGISDQNDEVDKTCKFPCFCESTNCREWIHR